MKITQYLARQAATDMLVKKEKAIEVAKTAFKKAVTDCYKKTLPADVMKLFKTKKKYFNSTSQVRLNGHGFNGQYVNLTETLPNDDHYNFSPDAASAKELMKLDNTLEDLEKEYKLLHKEIEVALIALGTFKRVQENLPEAVKYLPKSSSTALIPNLNSLRQKLVA